jgi:hypothetical protein
VNRVARRQVAARRELFEETGARRGMSPAIAEKDFWVCWVLKQLFEDGVLRERIVFKGGTTLSKVHKLIDRMSEDIDLVLDWRLLGYEGELGEAPRSATQRDKLNKAMDERAAAYIAGTLAPRLREMLAGFDGVVVGPQALIQYHDFATNLRVATPPVVKFRLPTNSTDSPARPESGPPPASE